MRLTLRTLLAYMDDILEPSQAKEIGARVAENPVASSLVQRIRDVMRRRRISSPELSGPGSTPDPNFIAEYLDNTLEPAAVADVEKVCLDSDTHLAEVAACHQILTIVLGEPVTVRPELRERMYALGAATNGEPIDASSILAAAPPAATPIAPPPARPVIPEYLRRTPLLKRVGPWLVVGIAVGAWLGLIAFDPSLRPGFMNRFFPVAIQEGQEGTDHAAAPALAKTETVKVPAQPAAKAETAEQVAARTDAARVESDAAAGKLNEEDAAISATLAADEADMSADFEAESESAVATIPTESVPIDEEPVDDANIAATERAATDGSLPPQPASDLTPAAAAAAAAAEEPVATVPAVPAPQVMYSSTEGVLLYRAQGALNWTVLARRSLLHVGDEIASPEPFTAELIITPEGASSAALYVTLAGGGRVRLLNPTEESVIEFELNRGRLGLTRPSGDGPKAAVGVTVEGSRSLFTLEKPGTRCGLLVRLPQPSGPPPYLQDPYVQGELFVVAGSVAVRRPDGTTIPSEAPPEYLEWTHSSDDFAVLRTIPAWLDPEYRPLASIRNAARSFEPEFSIDQPIYNSITPVLDDRRPQLARLAAETLALVDDIPDLVRALSSSHEEARLAAIVGLREWVLMSPENADILAAEVARGFREDEAAIVTRLLWGLTPEEGRQEAASRQVLEGMRSMNIAIRELAFYQARQLTGRDFGYRPLNPENQRDAALARWEEHLKRNEGLVPQ